MPGKRSQQNWQVNTLRNQNIYILLFFGKSTPPLKEMVQSCILFSQPKELHLSLLVPWVRFAVDEPPPTPLHQVTVPATLPEDTFGLEPQSRLQERQRAAGEG